MRISAKVRKPPLGDERQPARTQARARSDHSIAPAWDNSRAQQRVPPVSGPAGPSWRLARLRRQGWRRSGCVAIVRAVLLCAGWVAEWFKAHAWKVCIPARVSRVRIPPHPPSAFADSLSVAVRARKKANIGALFA